GAISPVGVRACDQANAPVIVASSRSRPVLLAVPLSVMTWSGRDTTVPLPRSRKVDSLRAGFPLRMDASFRSELPRGYTLAPLAERQQARRRGEGAFVDSRCGAADNMRSPADRKSTRLNSSHAKISYAVF